MKGAVLLVMSLAAIAATAAEAGKFQKSIPIPRGGDAKIGFAREGCAVLSVTVRNYPNREDIDKARHEKPDDHSWVWWDFHVENTGSVKCKIHLRVDIVGKAGSVVKSSDKSDTVDAGKRDDNIRLSTRMRTLDIVDAPKAEIRAEIGPR